ncbi:hypothetical protein IMZ48_38205 [Candidatus Bathyarchaeota archaeon]|nr:hypothetical protein [Candidatus Bathyarchaeota archaeon]
MWGSRFVEFESAADLRTAVEKLDGREFKGTPVACLADVCHTVPDPSSSCKGASHVLTHRADPA